MTTTRRGVASIFSTTSEASGMPAGGFSAPCAPIAPAIWLVAPAAVGTSLFLMFGLPLDTWIRLAVWLVIGLAIYAAYGRRHSRLPVSAERSARL
nr:amino acid permease C-terminal domain-containing protein [Bradyrhizobium acaciae]